MTRPVTEVACGVLINREKGIFLLGSRPEGKPCAGFWEFPGGKLEAGETPEVALARELNEELGIQIGKSYPWFVMEHDYPHAYVRLHFRRCFSWAGELKSLEHQKFAWFSGLADLEGLKHLPMNAIITERIYLPECVYAGDIENLATYVGLDAKRGAIVETVDQMKAAEAAGALYVIAKKGSEDKLLEGQMNTLPGYVFGNPEDIELQRTRGAHGIVVLKN